MEYKITQNPSIFQVLWKDSSRYLQFSGICTKNYKPAPLQKKKKKSGKVLRTLQYVPTVWSKQLRVCGNSGFIYFMEEQVYF
jgi:hypothetical protein